MEMGSTKYEFQVEILKLQGVFDSDQQPGTGKGTATGVSDQVNTNRRRYLC